GAGDLKVHPLGRTVGAVDRCLVPGGDIGSGARVEAVDALQDLGVDPSQVVAFGFVEFVEPGHLAMGDDVDLDRPARSEARRVGTECGWRRGTQYAIERVW